MTITLDTDRPLENRQKDHFGFAGMARRLAPSIIEASKGDGIVIGLEGRWGSGKTSLMNMLKAEFSDLNLPDVHTITISPWLNGDSSPLVTSLLEPMATILEKIDAGGTAQATDGRSGRARASEVVNLIREYGPKTARGAASIAKVASYFIPGTQAAGDFLAEAANVADKLLPAGPTPSEIKQKIINQIEKLDINFIVILDDLDRLEPAQAVEVVRLVRSVADFPRVAYLMCYDREVLAHALKIGLHVEDGDLFLQKIVQLTFNIPLPEPFDLRTQFLDETKSFYKEVIGSEASGYLLEDLKRAIDEDGMHLSTPREVKIVLNSIRFLFPQVKDDVYFPDFCRLQLIKTTNYKLYKWLENYLSIRSVLSTGDASVSQEERRNIGNELKDLLPSDDYSSMRSIWYLKYFIPGLDDNTEPEKRVFCTIRPLDAFEATKNKRLGSPNHYRFYFALTAPKTVMPDENFNYLLNLAANDSAKLAEQLSLECSKHRHSGRTWFEHVLDRIDSELINTLDNQQLAGLVLALSEMMDHAIKEDGGYRSFSYSLGQIANEVTKACLARLHETDTGLLSFVVKTIATKGKAINWLVGTFFRRQLYSHGIVGDEPEPPSEWEIPEDVLNDGLECILERISLEETKSRIPDMPNIASYLYGWLDISQDQQAVEWVREYCESDHGLIKILNSLRGWAMSDKVYYPLSEKSVSRFLNWDDVNNRLSAMKSGKFSKEVSDLELAIEQSHD